MKTNQGTWGITALKTKMIWACFIIFGVVAILFSMTPVFAAGLSGEEARALVVQTDNNIAPHQFESSMIIKNYKPGRDVVQNRTRFYRKGDKMVGIVQSPAGQKGQAFIRDGDNMWMYLPKSEKTVRIGAKDVSMGGEASNADLLRVDLSKDYNITYLASEEVDKTLCHKLELTAKQRTVAYDKVIYWIATETKLPVQREYYSISGKKLKTMYFQNVKTLGGQQRPTTVIIENATNQNYKTEMIYEDLNPNVNLSDNMFNPSYIKRLQ